MSELLLGGGTLVAMDAARTVAPRDVLIRDGRIAWVGKPGKALNTWRYELAPAGDGTDVTESFRLTDNLGLKIYWTLWGWSRGKVNRKGMQTTLERIKAEVESGASS